MSWQAEHKAGSTWTYGDDRLTYGMENAEELQGKDLFYGQAGESPTWTGETKS